MSSFQFSLKSVERLRERNRDNAAESLRQAIEAKNRLAEQVSQFLADMSEQTRLQAQASDSGGAIQTQRILESQRYQLHLLAQVKMLEEKIDLIEQECQRRKSILVQREQEVRALEKLRLSQLAQWEHIQSIRQQHRLDEWAGYRYWKTSQFGSSMLDSPPANSPDS